MRHSEKLEVPSTERIGRNSLLSFTPELSEVNPFYLDLTWGARNSGSVGHAPHGFRKSDLLRVHHKSEDIALCFAAEAIVKLPRHVNRKRRLPLSMKGAKSQIIVPEFFQPHAPANDANNVHGAFYPTRKIIRVPIRFHWLVICQRHWLLGSGLPWTSSCLSTVV